MRDGVILFLPRLGFLSRASKINRYDLISRCGISQYGHTPSLGGAEAGVQRPVLQE